MRLRELKNGTQICPEIQLDSLLDTHHGIAIYLASDKEYGHALVHVLPDFEGESLKKLEASTEFYTKTLNLKARCGRYEEFLYFSEPFPLGEFMFEWLERRGRVGLSDALTHIIGLLKILEQAREKGIAHGRITPKLVLMERTNDTVGLRLMGLGVASAMTESMQCDIDWFDYTFDLEGMSPVAVDIYGIAIILMGLVSGESGIDSFEATGLLPQMFRGGMLQQVMEKALALRMDAYPDILTFSLDVEAAMLEVDERRGEVYVGDLVGFESAVRSITSISEDSAVSENSGVWNSLFDTLEQEERSSLLYSLTSLPAIRAIDDEDEDVTRVTSMPNSVLGMRRIRSAHSDKTAILEEKTTVSEDKDEGGSESDKTEIIARPHLATLEDAHKAEVKAKSESETPKTEESRPAQPLTPEQRLADLKSLEDELKEGNEEEDDAPTRVMMRPNYFSIQFGQESQGVDSSIADVIQEDEPPQNSIAGMTKRIQSVVVIEHSIEIGHDTVYASDDLVAFPPEDEIIPRQTEDEPSINSPAKTATSKKAPAPMQTERKRKSRYTQKQRMVIMGLMAIVVVLFAIAIVIAVSKHQKNNNETPASETIKQVAEDDQVFEMGEQQPE